jgi:hypothetical protein
MLAVYEDDGEFTVRLSDSPMAKAWSPQVIQSIGATAGARKLTLITPTDTKVFKFGNGHKTVPEPRKAMPVEIPDPAAPPSAEMAEYEAQLEAEELQRKIDAENRTPIEFPKVEEPERVRRKRAARPPGTPSACGRCSGSGTLAAGGSCPVCHGKGSIVKWGAR